jgi:hypothetical protein
VVVTNFPETQAVTGTVAILQPPPATRLLVSRALVSTAQPTELGSLTEAGTLDATGFVSATFSLGVVLQGSIVGGGKVGAVLVPDLPEVLAVMRNQQIVEFPLQVEAAVGPSISGVHASTPATLRLAFPRYRVFFYNTTQRSAEVALYSYLASS